MVSGADQAVPSPPVARRARWYRPTASLERGRLALLVMLAILTVGAWVLTVQQSRTMNMSMGVVPRDRADVQVAPVATSASDGMAGMDMDQPAETGTAMTAIPGMDSGGWGRDGFTTFVIAWAVMMAAMMFPSAAPMVLLYRTVARHRKARSGAFVPTWVFTAGYLLVWIAIGAGTWLLIQAGSDLAGRLDITERATWAPVALGAVLIMAGLYQLTPLKHLCLDHCRSPMGFVMNHWRDGRLGALRMGVHHGMYCLGCCWALFAVLVAAGVMSLAWMLLLTLIVFAEKVLPIGRHAPRTVGVAFLIIGVLVASGATDMPWLA